MAPIEPDLSNSNLRPLSIFSSYLGLASGLAIFISRNILYHAYNSLPPSQATRLRTTTRRRNVLIFSILALTSLATTWYYMFGFFAVSYKSWAHEMGQPVPEQLWGERGVWGEGSTSLALGRWLRDSELFREAWELVIDKSRRYWWSQQILLGTAAWSVFLGIEGRKRNIKHLWAFMLLGQVVAISFAMNLFFVAVLLTPVPLPEVETTASPVRQRKRKTTSEETSEPSKLTISSAWAKIRPFLPPTKAHSQTWQPHAFALFAPLFVTYVCSFLLPYTTSTPLFMPLLLIPHLALFQPLYPHYLMPAAFGDNSPQSYKYLTRLIAGSSFLLHAKQSFVALLDSDPGQFVHPHDRYLAYAHLPHESERTNVHRSASAVGRVLGALTEHPAVSSVGWDVLMCGFSLGVWAIIRGLHPEAILANIGYGQPPAVKKAKKKRAASSSKLASPQPDTSLVKTPATTRRRKKTIKQEETDPFVETAVDDSADKDFQNPAGTGAVDIEGEEELPDNLEAGAFAWGLLASGGLGLCAVGVLG